MLVLAFDTATPAVTAALHDGRRVLAESTTIDARRHGELLVPTIQTVLAEAGVPLREVTAIVAGSGPGPYTGLRVGLMTAQGLATTLGVPAYGICTLDAVAYGSGLSEQFLAATDARRKEVFWARYTDHRTRAEGPFVDRPADVPVSGLPVVGAGAQLYPDLLGGGRDLPLYPYAGALAALAAERLAAGVPLDPPRPIYLRRPDAVVPGAPKRVTA
ncbi:TsaB protein, required for threonylcarbamoyladenosine (t(6)A) formation in tRNA [[Actinomadura] parvosata subsp. kistnae]|uniref:tRNA (Adenosine(37)-N6)-threonylcarbamoyltransferase complex dimerization subunit type 1 TsaB n=1 Tax=[Actinomadura] parvosata subsp. kistnae TaxID=1909395 RepID=A0A1V0A9P9_9ACTN|nr:tRNA (adenosine(37)-N6)-threonylcarbamoyltransferase complex dimerization subunit type 1 TsaB [Nonomuraea sp. ATCC 55076]AQZ66872.1 tRNA (adenosine(37)-N6)-threonylcarbamoyltransferase complex dimerization subunit type 1 TsaB [Nonomuraea sp. ATCC 55076]SPL94984.1 TsaB protein, required for threonylcarbamoyladenosine (t(6)A) formation in tRNA [Actinomadura parvosata subsp. kistnae]